MKCIGVSSLFAVACYQHIGETQLERLRVLRVSCMGRASHLGDHICRVSVNQNVIHDLSA